jgi:hypothetical protein
VVCVSEGWDGWMKGAVVDGRAHPPRHDRALHLGVLVPLRLAGSLRRHHNPCTVSLSGWYSMNQVVRCERHRVHAAPVDAGPQLTRRQPHLTKHHTTAV